MNNHKDIKKTDIEYGYLPQNDLNQIGINTLLNKGISSTYEFTTKKTEKLVTALYMVTDCMETDDAIKSKLRLQGVELLSDMHTLGSVNPTEKNNHISLARGRIYEILSFIDIAATIGFVSDMNSLVLRKEFTILSSELESFISKDAHFAFALDHSMFNVPRPNSSLSQASSMHSIKDIDKGHSIKDKKTYSSSSQESHSLFFGQNRNPSSISDSPTLSKIERSNKILSIIKEYKKITERAAEFKGSYNGISIKDISAQFTDCSEKTIQRELNELLQKGTISKIGSKRWSRYLPLES